MGRGGFAPLQVKHLDMGSRITFAAELGERSLELNVEEDVEDVFEAWTAAAGNPFPVTAGGARVYVNPGTVAYLHEKPPGMSTFRAF